MFRKSNYWIFGIFFVTFVVRVVGFRHAFPFIFHPDEATVIRSAMGIRFDSNPGHFDWPHLHFYITWGIYWIFIKFRGLLQALGLQESLSTVFPYLWRDPLIFYALSRVISSFMAAITALALYVAGKNLFSKKVGIIAAISLALMPFHQWHSHYGLIDVPMTMWIALAVAITSFLFIEKYQDKLWVYILSGLFIGFAASTKYNGGLTCVMIPLAYFFARGVKKSDLFNAFKKFTISGFASIFGFILGTPYSVFDFDTFVRTDGPKGALWQFANVGTVSKLEQLRNMFSESFIKIVNDTGYTFIGSIVIFLLISLFLTYVWKKDLIQFDRDRRKLGFLIFNFVFLFWYISGFEKLRSHYFFPTYPYIALLAAYSLSFFWKHLSSNFVRILVLLTYFSLPTYMVALNIVKMRLPDSRNELYTYVRSSSETFYHSENSLKPLDEKLPNLSRYTSSDIADTSYNFIYVYSKDEEQEILENISKPDVKVIYLIRPKYSHGPDIIIVHVEQE